MYVTEEVRQARKTRKNSIRDKFMDADDTVSEVTGEMDEDVLAAPPLNETKAFAGVKPLYCTVFFHRCVPFEIKSYLVHFFFRKPLSR